MQQDTNTDIYKLYIVSDTYIVYMYICTIYSRPATALHLGSSEPQDLTGRNQNEILSKLEIIHIMAIVMSMTFV